MKIIIDSAGAVIGAISIDESGIGIKIAAAVNTQITSPPRAAAPGMFDQAVADVRNAIIEIMNAATCVITPENGVHEYGIGVAPIRHGATAIRSAVAIEGDITKGGIADAVVSDTIVDHSTAVVSGAVTDKECVHKGGRTDAIEAAVENGARPIRLIGIEDNAVEGRATCPVKPIIRDRTTRGHGGGAIGDVIEKSDIGEGRATRAIDCAIEDSATIEGSIPEKSAVANRGAAIAAISALVVDGATGFLGAITDKGQVGQCRIAGAATAHAVTIEPPTKVVIGCATDG